MKSSQKPNWNNYVWLLIKMTAPGSLINKSSEKTSEKTSERMYHSGRGCTQDVIQIRRRIRSYTQKGAFYRINNNNNNNKTCVNCPLSHHRPRFRVWSVVFAHTLLEVWSAKNRKTLLLSKRKTFVNLYVYQHQHRLCKNLCSRIILFCV